MSLRAKLIPFSPAGQAGAIGPSNQGPKSRPTVWPARAGRGLVAAIVAVGLAAAWAIHLRASTASPVVSADNAAPPAHPPTPATAAADFLAFRPVIAGGATMSDAVGQPLATALRAATGQPAARPFPGRLQVAAGTNGYRITVVMPVDLTRLQRKGEIYRGALPGASHVAKGLLSVQTPGGHLYAVHMDPATQEARFRFTLSPDGQTLTALNWNATAVLRQTDASTGLG